MTLLTRRLEQPIGREAQVQRLQRLFQAVLEGGGTRVAFITGEGGIGKTFLLEHLRRRWTEHGEALVPARIIDLYDVVNHTVEGFLESLMRAYPADDPFWNPVLAAYEEARRALERARLSQEARAIRAAREALLDTVFRGLSDLGRRFPLVVFLDTAERWAYQVGPQQTYWAEAWEVLRQWLREWLRPYGRFATNLLWVMAGRPERVRRLREDLTDVQEGDADRVVLVDLPPFSEDEVREFLEAYGLEDWRDQAAQIRAWTQGHPLLLGLFVEMATRDARRTEDALAQGRPEDLVHLLMNTPEWMPVLPQLAVAARGLTPRHLAFMDRGEEPSAQDLAIYRRMLEAVRDSIFVKRRVLQGPDGEEEYLFLHDEMYRWARRAILPGLQQSVLRWLDRLREFSARWIRRLGHELGDIYLQLAEEARTSGQEALLSRIQRLEAFRNQQESDRLYYSLRQSAYLGMRHYQRSLWTMRALKRDDFMRMLQTEVWEYLDEVHRAREEKASWFPLPGDEDFLAYVRVVTAFYPVWQLWAEERLTGPELLERLRELEALVDRELPQEPAHTLARAWLSTAELIALAREGKFEEAIRKAEMWWEQVQRVAANLEATTLAESREAWRWQCQWNEALLGYTLGFLHSARQDTEQAVRFFTRAQHVSVRLPFHFLEATAANDGGFALAHEDVQRAVHKVRRAFAIRKDWGWGVHMALSLNTLARVSIAEGHYEMARELAHKAQNIFRLLGYARGLGLSALALAEAYRRLGDASPMLSFEQRRRLYEEAERQAREALHLEQSLGKENVWRAYDELGRTYRQLARLFREQAQQSSGAMERRLMQQAAQFARQSRQVLAAAQRVAREIEDRLLGEVLALRSRVNLLWLDFYMDEDREVLEEAIEEVLATIAELCPDLRDLTTARATWEERPPTGPCRHLAVEKGKVMVLRGRVYLAALSRAADEAQRLEWARRAGRTLLEAFEFSRLVGSDYAPLRIAGEQLVETWTESLRHKEVRPEDLERFVEAARAHAQELGLGWEESYLYRVLEKGELLPEQAEPLLVLEENG